eukprot:NODE_13298_length_170_cov_29.380165_g13215_i0.p1 GENE.NODE_13298_length_170_cov_29.380165_g13215_i0~~NODE_13298_length_170_cov_29.380165_g13215_i0.p1  ORF type:complete len:53 (+),score=16.10 NODE_13298_length_170_cov_29.380165_g13215_i0:28-159(+)
MGECVQLYTSTCVNVCSHFYETCTEMYLYVVLAFNVHSSLYRT